MKDVKQCSISSVAFTLEVDAYDTLYNYIESIRARYTDDPDGEEILADIESRIAELILAVHSAEMVVAKPLVDNIIDQLGSVDDICPEESASSHQEQGEASDPKPKGKRHLYRNPDDAPIGGVCSGIAAYIGCNASIVRAIALLLVFCAGTSIWVYIILWIVMPAAVTARQKLEMRGEPITVSSIKEFYESLAGNNRSAGQGVISSIFSAIGRVIMVIFKIIVVCIFIALIVAFVGVLIGAFAMIVLKGYHFAEWTTFAISIMALCSIAMLLALGIYASLQIINSRRVKLKVIVVTLLVWLLFSLSAASFAALSAKHRGGDAWRLNISPAAVEIDIDSSESGSSSRLEKLKKLEQSHLDVEPQ